MRKLVKFAILFCAIFLSSFLVYKATYFIGEKYFFDKLFYKKSEAHGYLRGDEGNPLTNQFVDFLLRRNDKEEMKKRLEDINNLFSLARQENNRVLGTQNSSIYKIAIIGDSYVYGLGVKSNERFAEVLEKKLNKIHPTKVFVLALPGDNILHNYVKFLLAKQHLDIDCIL